jgi:hypothetical protein
MKCEFCDKPATRTCEDCGAAICDDHTVTVKVKVDDEPLKVVYLCPERLDETRRIWGNET